MGTVNPRPRGGASLSGELRANRDDRQQIRRLLSTQVKPKVAAPVVTGGGVVGMAEVVSTSGTVHHFAGNSNMSYTDVTYGAPYDPNAGTPGESAVAVSSWLTVSGYTLTLEPGYYIPVMYARLRWDAEADSPPGLALFMSGGYDSVHQDSAVFPRAPQGSGRWGIQQSINFGPTFLPDGAELHAEVRGTGSPAGADNVASLSAIVWDITKLG